MRRLPLEGVRVLDVGSRIAAPFCAGLLAELGAETIKVEQPRTGEYLRVLSPQVEDYSLMWAVEGRSRKSITLDLRTPQGQELFRRLAATADVLCENFRPGTMERWQLGPEDLDPALIYVRISTFGQTGPNRDRPGVDLIGLAHGGVLGLTGHPGDDPVKSSVTISDHLTGAHAALAALTALTARAQDPSRNEQVVVDASLSGSVLRTLEQRLALAGRRNLVQQGNAGHLEGFHDVVEGGDGTWLAIAAATRAALDALRRCIGGAPGHPLPGQVAAWARGRAAGEAVAALVGAGVPAAVVADAAALLARDDTLVVVDDPQLGRVRQQAPVPSWPGIATAVTPAPALGEHNDEVWSGLGLGADELQQLRRDGVI